MPTWLEAGLWGLLGGGALILGALIAWLARVPTGVIAAVMAFGSGVLISAVAFDLMEEAADTGGLGPTALGFVGGAVAYVAANALLARRGARHRKRSGGQQPSESDQEGSGAAIAVGALLDGVPEGLSSAAGMKRSGRSAGYVFRVWGGIAAVSGLAALLGYVALGSAPPEVIAVITAVAAGAILTMIADTMIPEAFETTRTWTGLITTIGFLVAFAIERV